MKKSEFRNLIKRELIKEAKGTSYEAKLAEIEKQGHITTLEAKIDAIAEMINTKNDRLSLVNEDENLADLIDTKKVREMQKEIKQLEKTKMKLEKLYEKKTGGKKKDVVIDEDASTDAEEEGYIDGIEDEKEDIEETSRTDVEEEGYVDGMEDEKEDSMNEESNLNPYNKFKTMNTPVNEEFLRMQKLAGIKPLYEIWEKQVGDDRSEFEWVDQNDQKIPYFKAYQGINNVPQNKLENLIKAYGKKVMDPGNPDYHNPEKLWGDKLVSFFKDFYLKWADSIGNAEIRRKLQNPTKEDEDKYIDQGALVDAVNFIKTLPTIKGHQYLINDPQFSDILQNVREILDTWMDPQGENYNPTLAPLLITYTLKMFKDHVWDKPLGREFRNTK